MTNNTKNFLLTLAATTISIIITFGTTAIIEHSKHKADKRDMVMMIMFDMRESLKDMELCNSQLNEFYNLQVEMTEKPRTSFNEFASLAAYIPAVDYTTTTETIFRSNIETIQTLGSIIFVQAVSSFYDDRAKYKEDVIEAFQQKATETLYNYENMLDFNSALYPFFSQSLIRNMKGYYEQCKEVMKVTDQELEKYSQAQSKLIKDTEEENAEEKDIERIKEYSQNQIKLEKAQEEARKRLKK